MNTVCVCDLNDDLDFQVIEDSKQAPLLNGSHSYVDEDSQKSMAIANLQAILGDEVEIDKIISLLEANQWDVTVFSLPRLTLLPGRSMQDIKGSMRRLQRPARQFDDEEGQVRDPIQFTSERLIGGYDEESMGLLRRRPAQSTRIQRPQTVRSYRFTVNIDESNEDEESKEEDKKEEATPLLRRRNPGMLWQAVGYVKDIALYFWRGIVWLFLGTQNREAYRNTNSHDFNEQFTRMLNQWRNPSNQLVAFPEFNLYRGESFYDLCEESRRRKKPILILKIRGRDNAAAHAVVAETLLMNEHIRNQFNSGFFIYGLYHQHLPRNVQGEESGDIQLQRVVKLPRHATVGLWVLTVMHDQNIQTMCIRKVNSRLAGDSNADFSPMIVNAFIQSNLGLFQAMVEEDPEYRGRQLLQDAGLAPIRSSNGSIDPTRELKERQKRELEEAQMLDQIRQIEETEEAEREERKARETQELERQAIEREAKRIEAEEKALQERRELAQRVKESLPEEPAEGAEGVCQIVFRLPGTGERVTRRFMRDQTVAVLYQYIDSLADRIQFETPGAQYTILQSMPRKEYTDKDKTLGQAGLFPRAALQIKEND